MSLFGVQTVMNVFRQTPAGGPGPAQQGLDAVTETLVEQTGGTLRQAFQTGDKVQRWLVDTTFGFMTLAPLRSDGGGSSLAGVAEQVTAGLRRLLGGMGSEMGPGGSGAGAAQPPSGGAWPGGMTGGMAAPADPSPAAGGAASEGWGQMPNQS
jgi:hypothetical protein